MRPHDEMCRESQALCAPLMTFADSLRLCALSVRSIHETCRASQALCALVMKLQTVSGSVHFLCTPLTTTAVLSGFLHPHDEIADTLRLCSSLCTVLSCVANLAGLHTVVMHIFEPLINWRRKLFRFHKILMYTVEALVKWRCNLLTPS